MTLAIFATFHRISLRCFISTMVFLAMSGAASLASDLPPGPEPIDRKPLSVTGSFEVGILNSLKFGDVIYKDQFINRLGVWVLQEGTRNGMEYRLGLGGMYWYPFPPSKSIPATQQRNFIFGITEASLGHVFGNEESPLLTLKAGQFPFKYNAEASNLGEYLFRARAYPTVITTGGYTIADNSGASLLGIDLSKKFWDGRFSNDLLLTSETDLPPLYDFSLSYLGSVKPNQAIEVGLGVNLDRILPIRPSLTTPKELDNRYFHWNGDSLGPAGDYWVRDDADTTVQKITNPNDSIVRQKIKFNYYTFQSIKLMGRLCLDPKALINMADGGGVFGSEDLKLFTEVAVLGITNYPHFYEKITDRMPIMFGFNFPAFGYLDRISLQAERMTGKYANDWYDVLWGGTPSHRSQNWAADTVGHDDDWRWSIMAKKRFTNGIGVVMQVASDHYRTIGSDYHLNERTVLVKSKRDWYYVGQMTWGF
jgi:hypothetical protein